MLQYGKPVTDIAVFTGEEVPRRALTPDRLVPFLPGIMGKDRVESEQKRLANVGQPMREKPSGVKQSANIYDPEKWVNPLNGYAYDSFNKDALLNLAKVKNGRIILPGGAEYKVLLLPYQPHLLSDSLPFSYEVNRRIKEIQKAGVRVVTSDISSFNHLVPDVIVPENIAWAHRTGDDADIYFISNQEDKERNIDITLRCSTNSPTRWNPVTGEIPLKTDFKITLTLAPYESTFIVFYNKEFKSNNYQSLSTDTIDFKGDWKVEFLKNKQEVKTRDLFDWSKNENPLIKYYSGTAVYKSSFIWKNQISALLINIISPVYIKLGKVSNIATVRINDIDCGTAWTEPYQVDITKALKTGTNTLEIEVTNTWANAINGSDKGTPPFPGICSFCISGYSCGSQTARYILRQYAVTTKHTGQSVGKSNSQ